MSPAQYPGDCAQGPGMLNILNVAHHSPSQQKIVLAIPLIQLTRKHWVPYNFCLSCYSDLRSHSFLYSVSKHDWTTSWSWQTLLYLCRVCFFCFCPTFSSSECLLVPQDSAQAPSPPGSFCCLQTQADLRGILRFFRSTQWPLNQWIMVVCLLSVCP